MHPTLLRAPHGRKRPPAALAALAALLSALAPAVARSESGSGGPPPSAAAPAATAAAAHQSADVMVGNRKIATLRGVLFQNPPAERARVANERIEAAVESGRPLDVSVRPEGDYRLFVAGGRGLFSLTPGDLDPASSETLDQAVAATAARLEMAIRETREQRSFPALAKAI